MTDRHVYASDDGFFMTETEVFATFQDWPVEFEVDLEGPSALAKEAVGQRPVRYYRRLSEREAYRGVRMLKHASLATDEVIPCPPQEPQGRESSS